MKFTTRLESNYVVIEFEADSSVLLEARSALFVEAIDELLCSIEDGEENLRAVVLCQKGAAVDCSQSWLDELQKEVLVDGLSAYIGFLQRILSRISSSTIPWVYVASSDCAGGFWELAGSCKHRVWFSSDSLLGFTDMKMQETPPLGSFAGVQIEGIKFGEFWKKTPLLTSSKALDVGVVDFASNAFCWDKLFLGVVGELIGQNRPSLVRQKAFKDRYVNPDLAFAASVIYLAKAYQSWLKWQLTNAYSKISAIENNRNVPLITIDLDYLAPPTKSLISLLRSDAMVVFISSDSRALCQSLELVYSRLEKSLDTSEADSLWNCKVSWYQGAIGTKELCLRWSIDDRFMVSRGAENLQFLRLEGNSKNADCGLFEWSRQAADRVDGESELLQVAGIMAEGFVVANPIGEEEIPLSVYIRSLFFEEMIEIVSHKNGDFSSLVDTLSSCDWGFAGNVEAWDRFLLTRQDSYSSSDSPGIFDGKGVGKEIWKLGSWKHAKALAKKKSNDYGWNSEALSRHMAMFLGLIALHIARLSKVDTLDVADVLCGSAMGFPVRCGTPLSNLKDYGASRIAYYSQQHWPELDHDLIGSINGNI